MVNKHNAVACPHHLAEGRGQVFDKCQKIFLYMKSTGLEMYRGTDPHVGKSFVRRQRVIGESELNDARDNSVSEEALMTSLLWRRFKVALMILILVRWSRS